MPIYEYRCAKCEHVFEVIEKHENRVQKQDCPKCKKRSGKLIESPNSFNYSLGRSFSRMRHGQ
jgi:putative FmdB family regulatory protein